MRPLRYLAAVFAFAVFTLAFACIAAGTLTGEPPTFFDPHPHIAGTWVHEPRNTRGLAAGQTLEFRNYGFPESEFMILGWEDSGAGKWVGTDRLEITLYGLVHAEPPSVYTVRVEGDTLKLGADDGVLVFFRPAAATVTAAVTSAPYRPPPTPTQSRSSP